MYHRYNSLSVIIFYNQLLIHLNADLGINLINQVTEGLTDRQRTVETTDRRELKFGMCSL